MDALQQLGILLNGQPAGMNANQIPELVKLMKELSALLSGSTAKVNGNVNGGSLMEQLIIRVNELKILKEELSASAVSEELVDKVRLALQATEYEQRRQAAQQLKQDQWKAVHTMLSAQLDMAVSQHRQANVVQFIFTLLALAIVPAAAVAINAWGLGNWTAIALSTLYLIASFVCVGILTKNVRSSKIRVIELQDKLTSKV